MERCKLRKRQRNSRRDWETQLPLNFLVPEHASPLTIELRRGAVIHLFVKMAQKFNEAANFVFVQLIEQEPGIYNRRHPDYARRDKTDLAWEKISHEMQESGLCVFVYIYIYIYRARARQGKWQPQFPRIVICLSWTRVNWMEQRELRKRQRNSRNNRNSTSRQRSMLVFSQLRCRVVS
jgi:hypothetical protein